MERLWTPWRMRYVAGETRDESCIFCSHPADGDDSDRLILHRSRAAYIIMNLYPYNTAHVMVVPYRHAGDLCELSAEEHADLWGLLPWITGTLRKVLDCEGFNIGLNLGKIAGAGVAEHLHVHVVPRWTGDANFMPVLANTTVLPELLPITYAKLRAEMELFSRQPSDDSEYVAQAGAIPVLMGLGKVALRLTAKGEFVLPKGHVEPGEPVFRTAMRELEEELGVIAAPAGWAGTDEFVLDEQQRRVVYLIATAEPGPDFQQHLGVDTELFEPADAVQALSHESSRSLLKRCLPVVDELIGAHYD